MAGPSGSTGRYGLPYPVPDDTVDVPRDIKALAEKVEITIGPVPPGAVMIWLAPAAPGGWFFCLGQTDVPAAANPILTQIFGQDANGMVRMPNLGGMFLVGVGNGGAAGNYALGDSGGDKSTILSIDQLPAHGHGVTDPGHGHDITDNGHAHSINDPGHNHGARLNSAPAGAAGLNFANGMGNYLDGTVIIGAYTGIGINPSGTGISIKSKATGITVNNNGSGLGHENRPPFRAINYIIRGG